MNYHYCDDPVQYRRELESARARQERELIEYWQSHPLLREQLQTAAARERVLKAIAVIHLLADRLRSAEAKDAADWLRVLRPPLFTSTALQREVHESAAEIYSAAKAAAYAVGLQVTKHTTTSELFELSRVAFRGMP